eukprot:14700343-Alexandrium_andersonii.AAC.1
MGDCNLKPDVLAISIHAIVEQRKQAGPVVVEPVVCQQIIPFATDPPCRARDEVDKLARAWILTAWPALQPVLVVHDRAPRNVLDVKKPPEADISDACYGLPRPPAYPAIVGFPNVCVVVDLVGTTRAAATRAQGGLGSTSGKRVPESSGEFVEPAPQ